MEMNPEVRFNPNLDELSREAADFIAKLSQKIVRERGLFTMVLSGGQSPRILYEYLARQPFKDMILWKLTHLFWGDERCVAPDDVQSNFHMARESFLSKVPIPPENVHRIPGEMVPPENGADAYERTIRDFFHFHGRGCSSSPISTGEYTPPCFDLILLGVGKDGHTASLFPGDSPLQEKEHWVEAVDAPAGSTAARRITLTFPVINEAGCVLFMVSGLGKKEVIREVLNSPREAAVRYPAAMVRPKGDLVWFINDMPY